MRSKASCPRSRSTSIRCRSIPEGYDSTPHSELVEVPQDDGTIKEFFRRRRLWVRLDYLLSAWAQTPEDEQLLLGLIIRTVMENPELTRDKLKGQSFEDDFKLNILMSARLDEGTLARFWGSLNQPVRPAVQAWTAIPILPEKLEEFKRVQTAPARVQVDHRSTNFRNGPEWESVLWSAPSRSWRRRQEVVNVGNHR